jgi:hypothetical protein
MNFSISIPDNLAPGVTASRESYNAGLPEFIPDPDQNNGETPQIPNPAICATDAAYLSFVIKQIVDGYCQAFKVGKYTPVIPTTVLEPGLQILQQAAFGISEQEATLALERIYNLAISNTPALLPPPATGPEPDPDWAAFRQAILTENGYVAATAIALNSPNDIVRVATMYLADRFTAFETQGTWSEYLQGLLLTMSALEPLQQANLAQEFLALAQRCHLPQPFITAFQEAIIPPAPPPE